MGMIRRYEAMFRLNAENRARVSVLTVITPTILPPRWMRHVEPPTSR